MRFTDSASTYLHIARKVSAQYERSMVTALGKLVASRVMYGRGPHEFDNFRFMNKPLREWKRYTVTDRLRAIQEPLAPPEFRQWEEDKVAFAGHCMRSGLRTAPITAVIAAQNGRKASFGDVPTARNGDELQAILDEVGAFDGFAKPLGAGQGYGAFGFSAQGGTITLRDRRCTVDEFFAHCATSPFAPDGYLLQPRVVPHPVLMPIMPGPALGTVRILTFLLPNDDVLIPWAVLKIPAPGSECDNFRVGALLSDVNIGTGAIAAAVGSTEARPAVDIVDRHPTTGARFVDIRLPHWPQAIDLVTRGARAFRGLPALGWDVAFTPDGPLLIETNWMFATSMQQTVLNRGLAADIEALYARISARPAS